MIPHLPQLSAANETTGSFLRRLRQAEFRGEISDSDADRTVFATDNSVYRLTPKAVLFPRDTADVACCLKLLAEPGFRSVQLTPRGGGTGTNGQSLTDGLALDLSRHMKGILEINRREGWARVEAGVVKDQLNAALAPHGLFFAPELSTSDRATIGGMINTDACGQGSCLYGKTRNHVLELTTVLVGGFVWTSKPLPEAQLVEVKKREDQIGEVHRLLDRLHLDHRDQITAQFPPLNRCLTGYDLAHLRDTEECFDLNSVLCGSEGTLGVITEARIRVLPLPAHTALINLRYRDFDSALRDATRLMTAKPASIETVDSSVIAMARDDVVWEDVRAFFPEESTGFARGINIIEFVGDTPEAVQSALLPLTERLEAERTNHGRLGFTVARDPASVKQIWAMRKRAVGLLGGMQNDRRPIPFVEDTAVPPEHLADYIAEFRHLLDRYGVEYGMFGHVDAGVLHVRPALDMRDPTQRRLLREITDAVVALTRKYRGVLWGEHGKGVRSEYAPAFFGDLYPLLRAVKKVFDPCNQLNPGKIVAPEGGELLRIDGVPTRGEADRAIPPAVWTEYGAAVHCNGNGACFNWDPDDPMCPSWKVSRLRRHSPKGRAMLLKEWLARLTTTGANPLLEAQSLRTASGWWSYLTSPWKRFAVGNSEDDFSHAVKEAMDECLACKSCAGGCPIKVDVPSFRSKFLELYHGRYRRPLRDYLVAAIESALPLASRMIGMHNAVLESNTGRAVMHAFGLVDVPALARINWEKELKERGIGLATRQSLEALSEAEKGRAVVLVQDAFTSHYEGRLVLDTLDLISTLGAKPFLAPFNPNGKALHVHGFLGRFARTAEANAASLRNLADTGVLLVGLDPSITLTYRAEYPEMGISVPPVLLFQEWLARLPLSGVESLSTRPVFQLLPHCTERTCAPAALAAWPRVFERLGLQLQILNSGCCGMAGTYGHQAEHRETSKQIYDISWRQHVGGASGRLLATGYSCRSQVKRFDRSSLPHPVQALLEVLRQHGYARG